MKKATHSSRSDSKHSPPAPSRRRADDKHRAIVQAALDGFWINDMEGRLLEVNDSYCKMIGYTREELLTMSISEVEATETPEETSRHIREVMERGCDRFETRHRRKDGRIIDVEISANYIDTDGGQLFVFVRDVSERKLIAEALEYSERTYRTLVESLPQKVFLKDRDSVYVSCNSKYAEDHNIDPEDLPGHTDYDFYPRDLAEKYIGDDRRVMRSGQTVRLEERYIEQGRERIVETFKTPVKDGDGNTVGILGIFLDITERKQAEAASKEAERHYRLLAENTTDVVSIFDLDLNLVWVSPSIEKQTGYTPGEIKKVPPLETMTPESIERVIEAFNHAKQAYEQGKEFIEQFETEAEVYRKDGSTFWADARYRLVRDDYGNPSYILMQARDITEHRKADEALRASEERFRDLAELLPQTVFEADEEGRLTFINRQGYQDLGYSDEDVARGVYALQTVCPEDRARVAENIGRRRAGEELGPNEYTAIRKDGSRFPVIVYGNGVFKDGRYAGMRGIVVDITERKQVEEALRRSEEENRAVVELMPDMIFRLGRDGQYIDIKSYADDSLAMPKQELLKRSIKEVLPSEASALAMKAIGRAIATGEVQTIEYVLDVPAGERTFEARIARLNRDEVLTFVRDITERKQTDEALRLSEERYRLIAENTSDSIWVMGPDLRITYQSPSTERIFGYTAKEWEAVGFRGWVHPDYIDTVVSTLKGFQTGDIRDSVTITIPARHKLGHSFWMEISASAIRDMDGKLAGIVGVSRDITERKEAEDRLLEYRTAVEQSADGIALSDVNGNIRFVNESWARMHGYTVEELIGRHLSIFHTREQMESQVIPFQRSFWETGFKEGEVWHVRKDGNTFPTWMTTTLLKRANGEPFGMFALMRDITGQKEMEKRQREREIAEARAEELARSRSRLIESQESLRKDIASQLHGTVQNRLILLGHRLAELEARPASERTTEEMASIRHSLEELQRDQIRPISHRLYPSVLRLGIAAGLESLVDTYRPELPITLRVSKNLRDGEQANRKLVPDNVKLALYRVAEEVLANILKHTPAVNSVAVKVALSDGGVLRLTVSDDGCGFDTAAPQNGIGLAIISDYAAAAGASCEVKSVPGKGTRVTAQVKLEATEARPRRRGRTSG